MTNTSFTDCSPIFIVGAGRSGTTLLQMMLNAHPALSISGEFHFFDQIYNLKNEIPTIQKDNDLQNFLNRVPHTFSMRYIQDVDYMLEKVGIKIKELPATQRTYERFFHELLEFHREKCNAQRSGEKTPVSVRYLPEILEMYPNAKIIHIIRDPRAVIASLLKMPNNSKDVIIHAASWRSDIWSALEFAHKNNSNFITTHYEDLVKNPRAALNKIVKFLDEPFDDKMLQYQHNASTMLKDEPWKEGTFKGVYESSILKWQTQLSNAQICLIELITGSLMKKFGYTPLTSRTHRVIAMLTIPKETYKYFQRIIEKKRMQKEEPETIFISTDRVAKNLWKSLFTNIKY